MISEVVKNTIDNYLNDVIEVNGVKKPIKNSLGDYISTDIASIENFYKWFGDSKMVDSQNRPLVCYHISSKKFNVFKPSPFGKMGEGIYFTSIKSDLAQFDKYNGSIIYECYLKIENLLEIENPLAKRNNNNDGIIAAKGLRGQEEIKVYGSNQIKSTENDGTWDIDDNNIYS